MPSQVNFVLNGHLVSKNPPQGRVLKLAFAVVEADHMFGLCKEQPTGGDDARDVGDHGE